MRPQFPKPKCFLLVVVVAIIFALSYVPTAQSYDHDHDHSIIPYEVNIIRDELDLCKLDAKPSSCPVNCFRPDPVCGEDGMTYWCGCADAACAGVRVVKMGFCQVGNGGSGPLSGQALLLIHIIWLIVLGFSVLFGLF